MPCHDENKSGFWPPRRLELSLSDLIFSEHLSSHIFRASHASIEAMESKYKHGI